MSLLNAAALHWLPSLYRELNHLGHFEFSGRRNEGDVTASLGYSKSLGSRPGGNSHKWLVWAPFIYFIYFECKLKRTFILFIRCSFMRIYCKYVHALWVMNKYVSYAPFRNESTFFLLQTETRGVCKKESSLQLLTDFTHSLLVWVTFSSALR